MSTITVPFTQYLRPNGRRRAVEIDLADEDGSLRLAVAAVHGAGLRFECEELMSGTCSFTATDDEHGDVAIQLCPNGPQVPGAVETMIREAAQLIADGDYPPEEE